MKAKRTFVPASVLCAALVLGLALFLWRSAKEVALTNLASQSRSVRSWNEQRGEVVTQNSGAISSVWFSPDGQRLVIKSQDGTSRIWDASTGNLLTKVLKDSNAVSSAIVASSQDSTVRVWDVQTGKASKPSAVTSASFSPDGKQIVTSSQDGTARVWKLEKPRP